MIRTSIKFILVLQTIPARGKLVFYDDCRICCNAEHGII